MRPVYYSVTVFLILFEVCIAGIQKTTEAAGIIIEYPTRTGNVPSCERSVIFDYNPKEEISASVERPIKIVLPIQTYPNSRCAFGDIGNDLVRSNDMCRQKLVRLLGAVWLDTRNPRISGSKACSDALNYGRRFAKIPYSVSRAVGAIVELLDNVIYAEHEDVGALHVGQGFLSDPHASSGHDPQANGRGGKDSGDASEHQGSKGDRIIRKPLPEGFGLIALAVFFGCGGLTLVIMLGISWWCGWLR